MILKKHTTTVYVPYVMYEWIVLVVLLCAENVDGGSLEAINPLFAAIFFPPFIFLVVWIFVTVFMVNAMHSLRIARNLVSEKRIIIGIDLLHHLFHKVRDKNLKYTVYSILTRDIDMKSNNYS